MCERVKNVIFLSDAETYFRSIREQNASFSAKAGANIQHFFKMKNKTAMNDDIFLRFFINCA